ncbi:MAG: hypothetical protein IAF38_18300 [Bacteroidia bacterium]|nr:hypothetical protein [Bacteroidia bacterium]
MKKVLNIAVGLFLLFTVAMNAQCKSFVKKKCLPSLAPYLTNGQINTAVFSPGDNAEIPLPFFENTSYRVIVCNQETIGKVSFKVMDQNKNVLFDSSENGDVSQWDFKSKSNQNLILFVQVPEEKDNHSNLMHTGCVSVIIGFKKS